MPKAEPERSCIVTREVKQKEDLLRFVVGPDGTVVFDASFKLPGRGLYVSVSKLLLIEATVKRLFSKAAKEQVKVPETLIAQVETQLAKRVADNLSIARKAGQVITGFEKVSEAVKFGDVAALIHACDASDDQVRKLRAEDVPTFRELPREVLSQVLGRENAVHVAVLHGPAAGFFVEAARRFALFLA